MYWNTKEGVLNAIAPPLMRSRRHLRLDWSPSYPAPTDDVLSYSWSLSTYDEDDDDDDDTGARDKRSQMIWLW